jgi:hypothetical protein
MSVHLPVNDRRTCLSAVGQLASNYRFMAENVANSESNINSSVWQKSDAIKKIEWFADCFKNKLNRFFE